MLKSSRLDTGVLWPLASPQANLMVVHQPGGRLVLPRGFRASSPSGTSPFVAAGSRLKSAKVVFAVATSSISCCSSQRQQLCYRQQLHRQQIPNDGNIPRYVSWIFKEIDATLMSRQRLQFNPKQSVLPLPYSDTGCPKHGSTTHLVCSA